MTANTTANARRSFPARYRATRRDIILGDIRHALSHAPELLAAAVLFGAVLFLFPILSAIF